MSRTALARTYRPRRFTEVATQAHVSETLRSAVQKNRVAHAYLFCGPRGVGKTTLARVLAMALNCPSRGADGEPCGTCDSCERIWAGRTSLDVVEIDAASNRGVDDARDLRERAMYAPSEEDRYKIYIIDEAHMLTREAWNALLKILEEPPPRVIFVFATTEPQKIQQAAPPILSRCQRFDFHRISTPDLVGRLRTVMNAEGIHAGDEVLLPIALKADGGMRDGLSLLDQVLSFTEGAPTSDDVRRILGLVGTEVYLELFTIIADRRAADVFRFVGKMMDEGYDLAEFYRGLADFLRALLIVRLGGGEAEAVRADLHEAVSAMANRFAPGDLLRMLAQVAELDADGRFRKSGEQRILIELLLLRFAYLESTVSLEDVLAAMGGGGGDGGPRGNGGGGRPAPEGPAARPGGVTSTPTAGPPRPASEPAPQASAPRAEAPAPVVASAPAAPPTPIEPPSAPAPSSASAPAANPPSAPAPSYASAPAANPTPAPAPSYASAPAANPTPAPAPSYASAPAANPTPAPAPSYASAPAANPTPAAAPSVASAPLADPTPAPVAESAPVADPAPAADPTPAPVAESAPTAIADPNPAPAPITEIAPAPIADPDPAPAAESAPASDPDPAPAAIPTPAPEPARISVPAMANDGPPAWDDIPLPPDPYGAAPEPMVAFAPPSFGEPERAPEPPARREPEPEAAYSAPAGGEGAPIDPARLTAAWRTLLQNGEGLPSGMGMMVRAARMTAAGGRQARLEFPPGHPAVERLQNPTTRKAVEDALARRLGGPVSLVIATGAAAALDNGSSRFTAESVRADRLERLMEGEPLLAAAVKALDLELVD